MSGEVEDMASTIKSNESVDIGKPVPIVNHLNLFIEYSTLSF